MKRFHVHVSVHDLSESIRFYNKLFAAPPAVEKSDYAKWMLDDPKLSFAISQRDRAAGVDHLGFQVESDEELKALREQVAAAEIEALDQKETTCCYAKSDKYWVQDPQGVAWETFHTLGTVPIFGDAVHEREERSRERKACCAPESKASCCG